MLWQLIFTQIQMQIHGYIIHLRLGNVKCYGQTLENVVCDGQSVQHLFLSHDLWPRHNVAGQQEDTNSWKWKRKWHTNT